MSATATPHSASATATPSSATATPPGTAASAPATAASATVPHRRPLSRAALANEAWEAMLTAHSVLMKDFARSLVWEKASMREYDVLYTLSKSTEPLRLSELGRYVLLSQPALSRLVDRLEERDLVNRCVDPEDARAVHLSLTEAGRALQREIGLSHGRDIARAMTAALTDAELATLRELATRLHTAQEES